MPTYLLEIGTEELPANFVTEAIEQWKELVPKSLQEQFLSAKAVKVYGTPRRIAIIIEELPIKQSDREEEIKGPPVSAAFKDGKPTKAAEGFARTQGVAIEALEIRSVNKGEFVFVHKKVPGRLCQEILSELTLQWITALEGKRFMRWGDGELRFARPIRTLVSLWDGDIIPIELVNGSTTIKSDRRSRGHRILHPDPTSIPRAADYVECMRRAGVEVDSIERANKIEEQIGRVATQIGGFADISPELLAEVTNLVEFPTAIAGKFDREFLSLPTEVITTVMVTHQRYFPVRAERSPNSPLLPYFITISNGDPARADIIAAGNERVIRARLADAKFFYTTDCSEPLEAYLPQLETVTFQEDLGSIRNKVDRIIEITQQIAEQLKLDERQRAEVESTALLCKADLVTQMVYEFPELQGVMGEKYALASGESEIVARGIFEHYLPRGADDIMPESLTGRVVGIADRLDTLTSIFGLGMIPSGSSDPFALRRAANAIINIVWHSQLAIDLQELIEQSSAAFTSAHPEKGSPLGSLQEFFIQRIRTLLQDEQKIDYDLVNALLPENDPEYIERAFQDLLDVRDRAKFLQQIRDNRQLDDIYETVNRSTRLAAQGTLDTGELEPQNTVNPELFEKPCEQAFYAALVELVPKTRASRESRNYQLLVDALTQIAPTISNFFDGPESVLVMAENARIKQNRLALLGLLRNHARILADFGAIVKN